MWRRRAKEKGLNARAPAETENRLKELPEMPAKTRYLEWGGNCMVCEDWVVVCAVRRNRSPAGHSLLTG
jgi:hypothetical protein